MDTLFWIVEKVVYFALASVMSGCQESTAARSDRLKQEVERMKKRVAHWEEFDKENVTVESLRQLRNLADKGKKLEAVNASLEAELKK